MPSDDFWEKWQRELREMAHQLHEERKRRLSGITFNVTGGFVGCELLRDEPPPHEPTPADKLAVEFLISDAKREKWGQ
jgi:hypothetical protein